MKTAILGIVALALTGAACESAATTTSTANTASVNRTATANQSAASANSASVSNVQSDNGSVSGMNHGAMDHSAMQSSPNAANQPFDLQFLDTMTNHHQGAVEMAQMAVRKAEHRELKQFAQKIIDDQQKEIAQMKGWREKWYAGKPQAMNMEMPGMRDSMKMMSENGGMQKLEAASGNQFDLLFLEMMTPHHQGATQMAKDALTRAEHQEIKTLSNQIIAAQDKEIAQMNQWKTLWSK